MALPSLLTLEDAQAQLLKLAPLLDDEIVAIDDALGRYLAHPLLARRTQPAGDLSAMDGYAVMADDLYGPWHVIGESAGGRPYAGVVRRGEAVRISTGALIPSGAGSVIVQEDTERVGDRLTITGAPPHPSAKHVRPRGMDFAEGTELLAAGVRMGPAQLALAIAGGHGKVTVRRLPRVVIIDSGDELAENPQACLPHQIPASNGSMLLAMVRTVPAQGDRIGPVADTMDAFAHALNRCEDAEIIVTSGGASVGDHDLVRPALEAWGAKPRFWRIAIKPGKPLIVATRQQVGRSQIILGLPGNPASSYVTSHLFLLPLLRTMQGAERPLPFRTTAVLGAPLPPGGARREFLRARWDGERVVPQRLQDSGALASLADSNVLIERPVNGVAAKAGDVVTIYPLDNGGIA